MNRILRTTITAIGLGLREAILSSQGVVTGADGLSAAPTGDKLELVELSWVTHFYASDKLTYAATAERNYVIDPSIAELEGKLNPARFVRIHRATILNLDYLRELHTWFGGKMVARLKDAKKTELAVSRDRVRALKKRLGV